MALVVEYGAELLHLIVEDFDTVEDVKAQIKYTKGIPLYEQTLTTLDGDLLLDSDHLSSLGMHNGSRILLHVRKPQGKCKVLRKREKVFISY